jgi:hypothetical protein
MPVALGAPFSPVAPSEKSSRIHPEKGQRRGKWDHGGWTTSGAVSAYEKPPTLKPGLIPMLE